ncbi:sorting nexin [Anaeramoeba flamelloides]|uniref:Sorting nexin n=1 Tax=Anaeramoeba flamelloides TaxID=1746091 RepID=A0ABQ8ZFU2_9EUKA|nr:sorting nexin [Anaeramoeba flamelloides]
MQTYGKKRKEKDDQIEKKEEKFESINLLDDSTLEKEKEKEKNQEKNEKKKKKQKQEKKEKFKTLSESTNKSDSNLSLSSTSSSDSTSEESYENIESSNEESQKKQTTNQRKPKGSQSHKKEKEEKKLKNDQTDLTEEQKQEMDLERVNKEVETILTRKKNELRWEITVTSSKNFGSGMNKFTLYQVSTKKTVKNENKGQEKTSKSENENGNENDKEENQISNQSTNIDTDKNYIVKRRYSDFNWLRKNLVQDFPGVVVPNLPGKKFIAKFEKQFVEIRRKKLEIFLQRISQHPLLNLSRVFFLFTEKDVLNLYKTKLNRKQLSYGIKRLHNQYLEYNLDEEKMKKIPQQVKIWKNLGIIFKDIYNETQNVRKEKEQYVINLAKISYILPRLGENEESQKMIRYCNFVSKKLKQISRKKIKEVVSSQLNFEQSIDDQIKSCTEVENAFITRNKMYDSYQTSIKSENKSNTKLVKAKEKGSSNLSQLKKEYIQTMKIKEQLKLQNKKVTAVYINDLERMEKERIKDTKEFLLNYSNSQFNVAKYSVNIWEKIIKSLK